MAEIQTYKRKYAKTTADAINLPTNCQTVEVPVLLFVFEFDIIFPP